ncbi:MAG: alpha/beta fold hydrolase, partial [Algoriphagus sp.]
NYFKERDLGIPTLYIMGDQDVMFLEPVRKLVRVHKSSLLEVLDNCGHVVNVEKPDQFNQLSLAFLKNQV